MMTGLPSRSAAPATPSSLSLAVRGALLCMILGTLAPGIGWAQPGERGAAAVQRYAIPAGPLDETLNRFARDAGISLSTTPEQTHGLSSPGLQGEFSVESGLRRLLMGTTLEPVSEDGSRYALRAAPREADTLAIPATEVSGLAIGNALGSVDGYLATHSSVATKTSLPLLETSQSVSVVTREQMDDQASKTVQQAMRYTPGIFTGQIGASNRYDYVVMRGFADGSVDNIYLDGLRSMGDSGTFSSMQIDPYFLERIDVVKGPSSVLYGRSLPGGLVALTSKKPLYQPYHQVEATVGNMGQKGTGFDFSGPLDDDKRIAYRVVGLAHASDTQFEHVAGEKRYAIAPTLAIDFDEDTTLTLQGYLQRDPEGGYHSGVPADGSLHLHNGRRISERFFDGEPDRDRFERTQRMAGYQLEHRFDDVWTGRQNLRVLDSTVELEQVYGYGWTAPGSDRLNRYYSGGEEDLRAYTLDNMLQADFVTGSARHTLLLGLDYQRRKTDVLWTSGKASDLDAFDPHYGDSQIAFYPETRYTRRLDQTGLYLQDLVELDRWRFSLGLRQDWVNISVEDRLADSRNDEDRQKFTGRAGVLYRFDSGIAPYISYSESFNPNAYSDAAGQPLEPTEGTQWEAGLKFEPEDGRSFYTAALFHITQENVASKRPQETFYTSVGEVRSQGLELESHTQVTDQLKLLGSYTFTDIEYRKAADGNQGNTPNQAPRHMASLWADYTFASGMVDGLSVGGGARYVGKSWADKENTEHVPSYTLVDAAVRYDLGKLGLTGLEARLNANNLLNERYVASCYSLDFCYFGETRNVTATLGYTF